MKQKIISVTITGCLIMFSLYLGIINILLKQPIAERIRSKSSVFMLVEMAVLLVCFFCLLKKKSNVGILGVILCFSWIHQGFLPVVVSGLYGVYLMGIGCLFNRFFFPGEKGWDWMEKSLVSFITGGAVWIVVVCLMSAIRQGGISQLRLFAGVTSILLCFCFRKDMGYGIINLWNMKKERGIWESLFMAVILTMLMLQVGRMNITMDYDSLHYGLRTPYILNTGNGIYENLGNINLVYTYSKGLESLVMPLSGTATYGYVLSFNIWITAGVLGAVYCMARQYTSKTAAQGAAAVISCIPAIMNLSVTAKTDMITLLIQILMIYFTIKLQKEDTDQRKTMYLVLSFCCCLYSYIMKPTALVFSTVAYGAGLIYLWAGHKIVLKKNRCQAAVIPFILAFIGIWARTWMMTGVPITSVFTSIFQWMGFQVKWPFAFANIPNMGGESNLLQKSAILVKRLYQLSFLPLGPDMDHVIIAWGTGLIPVMFLIWLLLRKKKKEKTYLEIVYSCLLAVSLISVQRLWQIDGNYFMLFYVLTVILAVSVLYECESQKLKQSISLLLVPVVVFAAVVTSVTNWSGKVGFTPIRIIHRGYYNHWEENRMKKEKEGNYFIWNHLAENPSSRVVAFGHHPQVLSFPCNIQSYYDITGSGGNVWLVKKLDYFKKFLQYAQTEYIYVEAGYLEEGSRAWDVVRFMIEDGTLTDIVYENGNLLGRINLKPPNGELYHKETEKFYQMYPVRKPLDEGKTEGV